MLPPISPDVLARNPQFRDLYNYLTTKILNPDASTIDNAEAESDAALEQELRAHRAELARMQILQDALMNISSQNLGLSDEILDIIDIISTHSLDPTPLSTANSQLLEEELEDFKLALPLITKAISYHLTNLASTLTLLASTTEDSLTPGLSITSTTSPSALRTKKIDLLPAHAAHRRALIAEKQTRIQEMRVKLADVAGEVMEAYRLVGERALRWLEEVKHGIVEKAARAQLRCLVGVVEGMEGKLKVLKFEALAAIYNPEAVDALENYHHHLVDTKSRLQARQRAVEEELKRYDRAGGSDMKGLVKRYAAAMRSVETITKEIRKLEGGR